MKIKIFHYSLPLFHCNKIKVSHTIAFIKMSLSAMYCYVDIKAKKREITVY